MSYLPLWFARRRTGDVFDQRAQKILLSDSGTLQRDPLSAGGTVSAAFNFCVHRNVRAAAVNRLYLDRDGVSGAGPTASICRLDTSKPTQLGLCDNCTLNKGVGLTDDDPFARLRCRVVNDQFPLAHHVRNGFQKHVASSTHAIRIRQQIRRARLVFSPINSGTGGASVLFGTVISCRAAVACVGDALILRVDTFALSKCGGCRPNQNDQRQRICRIFHRLTSLAKESQPEGNTSRIKHMICKYKQTDHLSFSIIFHLTFFICHLDHCGVHGVAQAHKWQVKNVKWKMENRFLADRLTHRPASRVRSHSRNARTPFSKSASLL